MAAIEEGTECGEEVNTFSGDVELDDQIKNWLKWDKMKRTRKEIEKLIEKEDWETLRERLLRRISFGTAGLRAAMRAGFDSMNDLVVIQTAQGIAEYLLENYLNGKDRLERGIVIGYDGRHNSKRYAQLSANVFQLKGFKVNLYGCLVATPFVPFAILKLNALAGVMVTASHNPKEDNGYKVYWSNGAQIIPPHDKLIQHSILKHLEPEKNVWDIELLSANPLIVNPYVDMCQAYYDELYANIPKMYLQSNDCSTLKFVYSAMHGVGYRFIEHAFFIAKLNEPIAVDVQKDPDPEFPTVKFPNPEEGKSALKLSIELAEKEGVSVILANDPDADRLACCEKLANGNWKVFNGNEMGALLAWWSIQTFKELHPNFSLKDCYFIASTVSSKMLKSIAHIEGMNFVETLTGFKWMANKALELMEVGKIVLFAFEESIGYMFFSNVLDKDGISAATHLATMATYLRDEKNQTLSEKLDELYKIYGYHCTKGSYLICHDPDIIIKIFKRLRCWKNNRSDTYPDGILHNKFKIINVRDLTTGVDTSTADHKPLLPVSSSSQMITFYFENNVVITLRTSGTEPKIKYYAEMCGRPGDDDKKQLIEILDEMITGVVEEFLEPIKNNLILKSET